MSEVRAERPRRVRGGVRLRAREVPTPIASWAKRWRRLLEMRIPVDARLEGLEYARLGQVASLDVEHGTVRAAVQGRSPRPYQTSLSVSTLSPDQWDLLVHAMAGEAVFAAKLLAGDVPESLGELARRLDLELVPVSPEALGVDCSCAEPAPCKHAAAVAWLMTERLDAEPREILMLRGMTPSRLVDRLRQARAVRTAGQATTHADPLIPESQDDPPPLEGALDEFWRPGSKLGHLNDSPPASYAPHALLRRLGPSPLSGKFPLSGLLASIYDTVSEAAERKRSEAEEVD